MRILKHLVAALCCLALMPAGQTETIQNKDMQTKVDAVDNAVKADINRPVRDKWALVIGIGEFANPKIPRLKYATKDARDFYDYLVKDAHFAPDHVRMLLDKDANQRRILSEFGSKFLARVVKPDDVVVIFFSTHGSPSQMDLRGRSYLVAYDSDPEDLFATGMEMEKILESVQRRVLTDRVVMVLDACHSGTINPNAKGIVRSANFDAAALAEGSGQLVICSSQPDEQSWESRRYQNGVFTRNLLDGLRSKPDATLSDAFERMKTTVADEVREDHPGARQTPVLHSKWSGNDLIISVLPRAPQSLPESVVLDLEPDSAHNNTQNPMQSYPVAQPQTQTQVPTKLAVVSQPEAPKSIKLSQSYFCNEKNPRLAYMEACSQQAAHFNEPAYYYRKAVILIQMGNFSKAEQELKYLLTDVPNNSDYHLARAYCYHRMGQKLSAKDEVDMALFHNPSLPKIVEFDVENSTKK